MLQVLNGKERNQAFFQFLLFFLLTTALIVGAIYFNFRVPETEKNYLRNEVTRNREQIAKQKIFISQMEETKRTLDSLKKGGISVEQISTLLGSQLADLQQTRNTVDTAVYAKLNATIIDAFTQLQTANIQLKDLGSKDKELERINGELGTCKLRLDGYLQAYGNLNTRQ